MSISKRADASQITAETTFQDTEEAPLTASRRWPIEWILLALILGLALLVRWRMLPLPLERDEGEYAYGAQLLQGRGLLYRDLHSMKWPGIYAAYSIIISVLGETREAIRQGLLVINLASALAVFLIGRELMERRFAAWSAAVYLVLTVLPVTQGIIANAEHFALVFPLYGAWLLMVSLKHRLWAGLFLAGCLMGLGPTMKQHSVMFVIWGGLLPFCLPLPRTLTAFLRHVREAAIYSAGVLTVFGIMFAAIYRLGIWPEFQLWTMEYTKGYTSQIPLDRAWKFFIFNFTPIMKITWPVFLMAVAGLFSILRRKEIWSIACGAGLLLSGIAATLPGFYFRTHYFLFIMPGVAILAGFGLRAMQVWSERTPDSSRRWIAGGVTVMTLLIPISLQAGLMLKQPMNVVSRAMYGGNPFVETPILSAYLKEQMTPEDRVVIFGSEPQLCFESQRLLAGGFVYMYPLMERHSLSGAMQAQMIEEVTAARPEFAVQVAIQSSWLGRPDSDPMLVSWMNEYLETEFSPCGLVLLYPDQESDFFLEDDGETLDLRQLPFDDDAARIMIYRRRERGVREQD
ncbi:ArnT family glycosyltransferase [Planctomicrobium sp. SH661]|uniref:ArnT family glycosyltransferase n=1 Tax=Planctomicrobium sp. SH661 TaxID=3448124 RepID=UPI003F5B66F2